MNTPDPRIDAPEATVIPADSHGAVDLSARASAPAAEAAVAPSGEGLHIPLITTTDEENFQDVMSTSQAGHVVAALARIEARAGHA